MTEHQLYLNIGSNLQPEYHLPKAIGLLRSYGQVQACSTAWESKPIGSDGPNFLNACLVISTRMSAAKFKETIIRPIESQLRRVRNSDPNAPRTIDIDIIMIDGTPVRLQDWNKPFLIVPLAELTPDLEHPHTGEKLAGVSKRLQGETWISPRPDVVDRFQSTGPGS